MEIVKECGTSILSTILEDLLKSTGRQVGYIFRFKSIIEDLNEEAENLRLAQENMQYRVDGVIIDTDEIEEDVEKWLRDVTAVVADAEDLEKQTREMKTCLNGLCPNWIWRYKMARRAQKKISIMSKLKDGGINVLTPKDFMPFESTTYTFNLIIEALKDDKTNVVGLYGMGGVGKTTLAKAVVKKAKEEKIFNEVVMVVVSNRDINEDEDILSAKIRDIQGQLADFLNLKLKEETIEGRAGRLYMRLKNEKKILIILDDIWEKIDLEIIGIPVDDHHKDCKIFLTTSQKQVCIDMGCQSQIPLDVLNEEEGLALFKRHAGLHDVHSQTMIKLAKEVVKECKGLPLAIVTIGSALKQKAIDEWKMVTQKLKKSKLMDVNIVDAKVYACLKLSYDYLKNDKTKSCFLLCSLFPEDHEIDMEQLVRYGLGLGLYQDIDSIEEARSELRVMVNDLKASSLLLDAKEGYVKMHDVVRDVALWITSKGEEVFMVKAGMGLTEWPKHEGLEQCTAISLMENDIEHFPNGLVCPKLNILLLEGNNVEVSEEFFKEMKTLKVASLSWVHLSLNSLQFLKNLVTLQLINCELRDISLIKKLAKLEILILKGSKFVELPEELRELRKLRMLDITDCWELKRIPANVIPRLSRLEELYIGKSSFKAWEVEGTSAEGSNASLSELSKLYRLSILCLFINVHQRLPKDFVLPTKLLRYDIRVMDVHSWLPNHWLSPYDYDSYPKSRLLKIGFIEATSLVAFKALYENVKYLELMEIEGCCQNMVPSIDETGLNELKRLSLSDFDELECIIDTTHQQDVPSTAFSNLVHLSLKSVGLREICSGGRPPGGFLENLETLKIRDCDNMSSLFPSWVLIQRLRKLKKVSVWFCDELEDVFQLEGLSYAKENPFLLSSLESLHLSWLHNLRYIWKGPTQQVSLRSLTVVEVKWCNELRYLFTLSLAQSLLQLEQLKVRRCGSLEHIVEIKEAVENVGGGGGNDVMFPKLRILNLDRLENFINFYSENSSLNLRNAKEQLRGLRHGLQSLEELYIEWCGVQVLFHLEGLEQKLAFPSLKVLELSNLMELECLCKGATHLLSLPNLKKLEVTRCNRLRHMFSPSLTRNLFQLEELFIQDCGELEYIVSIKAEENVGGGGGNDVMLPKLRILKLHWLENFIDFYSENLSLNVQTTKKQLRGLRHGLQNLEELYIRSCRVQVLFHLEGLEQELAFPSLKVLELKYLKELECLCKGPMHLLILPNLKKLIVYGCDRLRHMFSPSLARNLLQLESIYFENCKELEQIIVEDHTEDDHVQLGLFPNLSSISVKECGKLKTLFPITIARSGLQKLNILEVEDCGELEQIIVEDHTEDDPVQLGLFPNLFAISIKECGKLKTLFPITIARSGLQKLNILIVEDCGELEQIIVEDHTEDDHVQHGLFPNLSSIYVKGCDKLKSLFPAVTIARLGLQKLNILIVEDCGELEQIIVEDHTEDDHVQHGLFPNLSSIYVKGCDKLKSLVPAVTIARLGLQKLRTLNVYESFQLEELFGHKDEANMTSHREMVLPQLEKLSLQQLASLINFCPVGYHFIFPSLSKLVVTKCPKLTTQSTKIDPCMPKQRLRKQARKM